MQGVHDELVTTNPSLVWPWHRIVGVHLLPFGFESNLVVSNTKTSDEMVLVAIMNLF